MRSDRALLLDMLLAAQKIVRFTSGQSEADFLQNEMLQSAVIREFQVIGAAGRLFSADGKETFDSIPWLLIAGMRNRPPREKPNYTDDVSGTACPVLLIRHKLSR